MVKVRINAMLTATIEIDEDFNKQLEAGSEIAHNMLCRQLNEGTIKLENIKIEDIGGEENLSQS